MMGISTIFSAVSGLFGGSSSMTKWIGIGLTALAVAGVIVWLGWSRAEYRADYEAERAARVQLQTAYEANAAALSNVLAERQVQAEALAERDTKINEINAERESMRLRLREAMRHDKTVRDWADTELPDAVRGLLQ